MTGVEILVKLIAPDPWSFTVYDALSRKFGLEEIVGIERIKTWALSYDVVAADDAVGATETILRETVLLANPNRDIRQLRRSVSEPAVPGIFKLRDGVEDAYVVKVHNMGDTAGENAARIARSRLGIEALRSISSATAWVIEMSKGEPESRRIAESVAVLEARGRGLLANPHCQEAEVVSAGKYLLGGSS
jgi:hypothetical protein